MRRVAVGVLALCISSACLLGVVDTTHAGLLSVAVNDSYSGRHDRILSVAAPGVLRNDVDVDLLGGTAVDLVSNVSNGTLNLAANGGFTYAPRAGYVGQDSFRYRLRGLLTTSASVTLTITNAPPLAAADTYTVTPGKTLTVAAPGVLGNDGDADGDVLTVDDHSGVSGSLDLKSNGAFSYTPNGGFSGSTTFTYTITDGIATSTATVTLTRAPVPSPTPAPTATPTPQPIVLPSPLPSVPLPSVPLPTLPPIVLPSLPLPTLPPVLPTVSPGPSVGTSVPTPSPSPAGSTPPPAAATPTAQASGSPSPSHTVAGAAGGSGEPPVAGGDSGSERAALAPATGGSPAGGLDVQRAGGRDDAGLEIPLLGSLGLGQLWWVPAATIGGPGLLVLLFVALQLVGGLAWLPATRRFRRNGPQPAWIVTSATPPD